MRYPIRDDIVKPYPSIHRVHPLKQKHLEELIEHTRTHHPDVLYLAVFGSTVDGRCRPSSDIDLCVWGGQETHFCPPDNDVYDVVHAEDLAPNSPLRAAIKEEGYLIYEKDSTEQG